MNVEELIDLYNDKSDYLSEKIKKIIDDDEVLKIINDIYTDILADNEEYIINTFIELIHSSNV